MKDWTEDERVDSREDSSTSMKHDLREPTDAGRKRSELQRFRDASRHAERAVEQSRPPAHGNSDHAAESRDQLPVPWDVIAARSSDNRIDLADDFPTHLIKESAGYFDVVIHGKESLMQADIDGARKRFNIDDIATMVRLSDNWRQRSIRFLSCTTGKGSLAQDLANKLEVPVYAPTEKLRVMRIGETTITFISSKDGTPGYWKRFEPMR